MTYPKVETVEIPILQELSAVGGVEDIRFLYSKLIDYFPQLSESEILIIKSKENSKWRRLIQIAGKNLDFKNLIRRKSGVWEITARGLETVNHENQGFNIKSDSAQPLTHSDIQNYLSIIGKTLGFVTQTEFEYYDVIWKESSNNQRISHIFEVQSKGNIDSAFAKLKRAYQAQRTKPFLVLSTENDTRRARNSLQREFADIQEAVTILSFSEVKRIHDNLISLSDILPKLIKV